MNMSNYGVVIPAFNAAATIAETLRSVLEQTIAAEEILVVDDGSTDDTAELVLAMGDPVRLLRQDNAGPGKATTAGIMVLSTPLVAMLDSDDLWLPHKIERQLAHLDRSPQISGVFGHIRNFRDNRPEEPTSPPVPGWSRSTMMFRREMLEAVGPILDPEGRRGEMIDWIARAREAGFRLDMIDEVLALRRIRPGSLSYGRDPARDRGYLEVARLALKRRAASKAGSD